jgi:hypothetical protein
VRTTTGIINPDNVRETDCLALGALLNETKRPSASGQYREYLDLLATVVVVKFRVKGSMSIASALNTFFGNQYSVDC